MHSIFKYQFIYHPSFHEGLVYNVSSRDGFIDVFFFENQISKKLLFDYVKENCHELVSLMKLKDIISTTLIDYIFDSWTQDKGKKYVSDTRISIILNTDYEVKAYVVGTHKYQVKIKSDAERLSFDCSCPVIEDECKHTFALMKYLAMSLIDDITVKRTPFEEMFHQMSNLMTREYFDLGFEMMNVFFEKEETNTKSVYQFLRGYDYYTNKAFIPLVLNQDIFKVLINEADYDSRLKLNKVHQRYQRAIEGRSTSVEDILLSHIFMRRYEGIFAYNFYSTYLSPLGMEAIIYAALHANVDLEMIQQITKLNIKDEDIVNIFNHISDKSAKKYLFLKYRHLFNNLNKEEIEGLEYSVEEIYELFLHSQKVMLPQIVLTHYQRFIDNHMEDYLPKMVKNAIDGLTYRNDQYLELYKLIESLDDNSLLLKIDFKSNLQDGEAIINRWRGYDDI